jgi:hypothetical protein
MADVLHLEERDGRLVLTTKLASRLDRSQVRITIEDLPGITTCTTYGGVAGDTPRVYQFHHCSYSNPAAIEASTRIDWASGNLSLYRVTRGTKVSETVSFNSTDDGGIQLAVMRDPGNNIRDVLVNQNARNLAELRERRPDAVNEFLRPLLHDLGQDALLGVDAAMSWGVFADEWPVDPKVSQRLKALLAGLDADGFAEREKASEELASLGREGAAAIIQLDRKGLTEQQNTLLDAAVATFKVPSATVSAKCKNDPAFLLDCLYSDDPAVRRKSLEHLKAVTAKEIAIDLDAPLGERGKGIEKLRKELVK